MQEGKNTIVGLVTVSTSTMPLGIFVSICKNVVSFSQQGLDLIPGAQHLPAVSQGPATFGLVILRQQERAGNNTDDQVFPCPRQTWVKTGTPMLVNKTRAARRYVAM
ncbi:MAG TPA: hypothetical protein VI603_00435 [Saprospiraceae bacterium]|nr:hypothetical protein [Saprospiraceae bacterium]